MINEGDVILRGRIIADDKEYAQLESSFISKMMEETSSLFFFFIEPALNLTLSLKGSGVRVRLYSSTPTSYVASRKTLLSFSINVSHMVTWDKNIWIRALLQSN